MSGVWCLVICCLLLVESGTVVTEETEAGMEGGSALTEPHLTITVQIISSGAIAI